MSKNTEAVQHGLTTKNTYVILARNGRLGAHLALRPHVRRMDENTIWLGGRLRIAFDFDGMNHQTKKSKVVDLTEQESIAFLKKEFPGFAWQTGSIKRCSTTVGILIAAGQGDEKAFMKQWKEIDFVGALLDDIQNKAKRSLTGFTGLKNAKTVMVNELNARYESKLKKVFGFGDTILPSKLLGEVSDLLNSAEKRPYQSKRKVFQAQIAKAAA